VASTPQIVKPETMQIASSKLAIEHEPMSSSAVAKFSA
jgi:hypothetical protein